VPIRQQPTPVADFDDGGETVEVLTTHWINDADIGDGSGPVTDSICVHRKVKPVTVGFSLVVITVIGAIALSRHCLPENIDDLQI
jgi:hypothetical protein